MNNKERFDAFMQLANCRREIRQYRMSNEWKLAFAIWALVAASATTLKAQPICFLVPGAIVVFVLHACWISWHFVRSEADASAMYGYEYQARLIISADAKIKEPTANPNANPFAFFRHPPALMQLVATALLLAGVITFANL